MRWLLSWTRRHMWALLLVPVLGLGVLALTQGNSSLSATGVAEVAPGTPDVLSAILWVVLIVAMLSAFLVACFHLLQRLAGRDPDVVSLVADTSANRFEALLLERWLRRSRHYRFVGGFMGFIIGSGISTERYGELNMGAPVVVTLLGIAAGGALAEIHVLGRERSSVSVVDLSPRRFSDYTTVLDRAAIAGIGVTSVLIVGGLFTGSYESDWPVAVFAALLTVLLVVAAQYLLAVRSRPALQPELRRADDLLRRLAATQGFTRPAVAGAFFLLAAGTSGDTLQWLSPGLMILGFVWMALGRQSRIPKFANRVATA